MELGGRDMNFFPNEIDNELLCSLCHFVLVNPKQTPCGHVFCAKCITDYLTKGSNLCPQCSSKLTAAEIQPAPKIVSNLLMKLVTKCDALESGCAWFGEWIQLEDHLEKECEYILVNINESSSH
jgi:hypothetical protein